MKFKIEPSVLEMFPHVTIGAVQGTIAAPRSTLDVKVSEFRQEAMSRLDKFGLHTENLTSHPHISAWRAAYQRFGVKAKKHNPTHEALARRLLKDSGWPTINPIVDIYLTNQAATLLPHGGYDYATLSGTLRLTVSKEPERFEPLGGGEEFTTPGEVLYRDDQRILTRRWNYRDCEATKITDHTKTFLLMIEAPSDEISREAVDSASRELVERYQRCFEGEFKYVLFSAIQKENVLEL